MHDRNFWRWTGLTALVMAIFFMAASAQPLNPASAKAMFEEAKSVSAREGGSLWKRPLYGPMLFVEPTDRTVIANEPDAQGRLKALDGVFVGKLDDAIPAGNTALDWLGIRWTMLVWPVDADENSRRTILAHEMFHRLQPQLGLYPSSFPALHLDTLDGRLWLQLEWRALGVALLRTGADRDAAIADALSFRAYRRSLFAGSAERENAQEIVEGLAEYTGAVTAGPNPDAVRWRIAFRLLSPDAVPTFMRFFPYIAGPGYGLLLDDKVPGWRKSVTSTSDLAALLAAKVRFDPAQAERRAAFYGATALRAAEQSRADKQASLLASYRRRFIDGPTLTFPTAGQFYLGFNPSTLVALGDAGTIYPTMRLTDAWGKLEVTDGALVSQDLKVTVNAPAEEIAQGPVVKGGGWTLTLAPGWRLVETGANRLTVRRD